MRVAVLGLVALALGACASAHDPDAGGPPPDGGSECHAAASVTYGCAPVSATSVGCTGLPLIYDDAAVLPDPTAVYPPGCEIRLPFCHPYYPSSVASCTCSGVRLDAGVSDGWECPL